MFVVMNNCRDDSGEHSPLVLCSVLGGGNAAVKQDRRESICDIHRVHEAVITIRSVALLDTHHKPHEGGNGALGQRGIKLHVLYYRLDYGGQRLRQLLHDATVGNVVEEEIAAGGPNFDCRARCQLCHAVSRLRPAQSPGAKSLVVSLRAVRKARPEEADDGRITDVLRISVRHAAARVARSAAHVGVVVLANEVTNHLLAHIPFELRRRQLPFQVDRTQPSAHFQDELFERGGLAHTRPLS
mmetsp:Transcript_2824/g.5032  ORF Transcript_2824/g.5032 Transcript_2824/m.5032 type:complete len:242 (-) Transcript_2824:474-1199(-)